jgi:type II secretory pathway component PulC
VTSVNGLSLGDPAAAAQVMTQISSASQLTLTVDRGGQQETLVVPFGK